MKFLVDYFHRNISEFGIPNMPHMHKVGDVIGTPHGFFRVFGMYRKGMWVRPHNPVTSALFWAIRSIPIWKEVRRFFADVRCELFPTTEQKKALWYRQQSYQIAQELMNPHYHLRYGYPKICYTSHEVREYSEDNARF